ncbi:hypothetical protein BHYA_0085g00110 [Botrytis hyacinthi]|uniref:Uncharacterized protein n=1 Tax=Botrytis hyacinthi TaxID=278943 RepID=A0A4Z1GLX8_9HELO|nr:hypothetical protein BHYA_0085g00110 [Botrytis hyacinthi]
MKLYFEGSSMNEGFSQEDIERMRSWYQRNYESTPMTIEILHLYLDHRDAGNKSVKPFNSPASSSSQSRTHFVVNPSPVEISHLDENYLINRDSVSEWLEGGVSVTTGMFAFDIKPGF